MAATSHLQATKEPRQAGLGTGGREGHQQARGFGDEGGKGVLNLSSIVFLEGSEYWTEK